MLGALVVHVDVGEVDLRLLNEGELHLGLLGNLEDPLVDERIVAEIDSVLFLEEFENPIHDAAVEVVASQEGVPSGRENLEDPFADLQNRDVEGSPAEVVDEDLSLLLVVEAVGEAGGGGLVDDPGHLQTGDGGGVFGRLPLGIVEVGRNRDDRRVDRFVQVLFRVLLQVHEKVGRNFLGRQDGLFELQADIPVLRRNDLEGKLGKELPNHRGVILPADKALDGEEGLLRIRDDLTFRGMTENAVSPVTESHHRRGRPGPSGGGDNLCLRTLHVGDTRVGGP